MLLSELCWDYGQDGVQLSCIVLQVISGTRQRTDFNNCPFILFFRVCICDIILYILYLKNIVISFIFRNLYIQHHRLCLHHYLYDHLYIELKHSNDQSLHYHWKDQKKKVWQQVDYQSDAFFHSQLMNNQIDHDSLLSRKEAATPSLVPVSFNYFSMLSSFFCDDSLSFIIFPRFDYQVYRYHHYWHFESK